MSTNRIVLTLLVVLGALGCSPASTTLNKGMSLQDAVDAMHERGLKHHVMDMTGDYRFFTLPDGRVLILSGSNNVDSIEVIVNPWESKAMVEYKSVDEIKF